MKFSSFAASVACLASGYLLAGANAQAGPNTMAVYDPNVRTFSANCTFFILPVSTSVLQKIVPYPLLSANNKTIFPKGFPAGMHPVITNYEYDFDIRMFSLEIDSLMASQVYVPLVDRLSDGKTPFIYSIASFIGGTNGQSLMGVVPSVVGTIEGTNILIGEFLPDTAAYSAIGTGKYSAEVKDVILPNPISGPGVVPAVADMLFQNAQTSPYTPYTFHSLLNAPLIQNNGECQDNIFYFNQTFTGGTMQTGNVTLYSGAIPASLAGIYTNVGGYSANPVQVGFNAQSCSAAAAAIVHQK